MGVGHTGEAEVGRGQTMQPQATASSLDFIFCAMGSVVSSQRGVGIQLALRKTLRFWRDNGLLSPQSAFQGSCVLVAMAFFRLCPSLPSEKQAPGVSSTVGHTAGSSGAKLRVAPPFQMTKIIQTPKNPTAFWCSFLYTAGERNGGGWGLASLTLATCGMQTSLTISRMISLSRQRER